MSTKQNDDSAFAFMKNKEDFAEWEANQAELDRQWYDAEEEGIMRYGADELDITTTVSRVDELE